MPNAPTHGLLLVTGHFHDAPVRAERQQLHWARRGRIRTENDIKRLTVSGAKNASLPAQWDTLPKPCFWEGSDIRVRSLSAVTRYKTYLPLGGSGHSRGHVANHGVVHISQRTRRTERKDIHITLVVTRPGGNKRRTQAKDRLWSLTQAGWRLWAQK